MNEHPEECPCGWCDQPGHISSQCTARHDSDVMRQRFPKKVKKKKPIIGRYQCWKCGHYHSFKENCPNVPYPQPRLGECKACRCIDGPHVEGCDYDAICRKLLLCMYCRKAYTSTRIAGNDNTKSRESPEEGTHPIQGGHLEDEALNMNHPLSGKKSIPSGHPLLWASIS